jgi:hypothetical protein
VQALKAVGMVKAVGLAPLAVRVMVKALEALTPVQDATYKVAPLLYSTG